MITNNIQLQKIPPVGFDPTICVFVNPLLNHSAIEEVLQSTKYRIVSIYVVCETQSVKQVLAAVVEILVQKSQFTLNWDLVPSLPPPPH